MTGPQADAGPPDVRLVVADMDGTLLDGEGRVPDTFWPLLDELRARGVAFCPASGRQCATLQGLFAEVADGMVFIAENGALVVRDGTEVSARPLRPSTVDRVVDAVRGLVAEGVDLGIVVCGTRGAYVERSDEAFMAEVRTYYLAHEVLPDATASDDRVVKLAVYAQDRPEDAAEALRRVVDDEQVVVSGEHWIDVMAAGTTKGAALQDLQRSLGVSAAQTMVFGDYLNDLEMLAASDWSYAMENAHPDVRAAARFVAPRHDEDGVVRTIRATLGLGGAGR